MTSSNVSKQNTSNELTLTDAIYGPCTDLFREFFKNKIPQEQFLLEFKIRKALLLRIKPESTKMVEKLFDGTYEKFDLSLLYFLLRNTTKIPPPLKGWGKDLDKSDTSNSACIERIKRIRNVCCHSTNGLLKDEKFQEYWKDLEQSVMNLELSLPGEYNPKYSSALALIKKGHQDCNTQKLSNNEEKLDEDNDIKCTEEHENEREMHEADSQLSYSRSVLDEKSELEKNTNRRTEQNIPEQDRQNKKNPIKLAIIVVVIAVVVARLVMLYYKYNEGVSSQQEWNMNTCIPKSEYGTFPGLVTCDKWNARSPKNNASKLRDPHIVVIIHGVTNPCYSQEECIKSVQAYQDFHMNTKGWDDIGYNFLIGEDGNVYEGLGPDSIGAHTLGYNANSIGICFIGNYNFSLPNRKALEASKRLIKWLVETKKIPENYILKGHRDLRPTESPGQILYQEIQNWPHYAK